MKTIEELGISPAPWSADDWIETEHGEYDVRIRDANDNEIAQPLSTFDDASFIASAPELYEALRNMTELFELNVTEWNQALHDALVDAKAALAKASGEEAK